MKKICAFLLVLCLVLQAPLAVFASGEEYPEVSGEESVPSEEEASPARDGGGSPGETDSSNEEETEQKGQQERARTVEIYQTETAANSKESRETGVVARNVESPGSPSGQTEGTTETPAPSAEGQGITAPSAILIEASTGTVVLEKNSHEKLPPASVTKIMTLLLIFDALAQGKIKLEDMVTTSTYAASMGGSQVFLEEGETQTVETMIKCISVASANDASVAMAEHIAGTEELFVEMMNERARGLGMSDTHFVNCCGLDVEGHVTTAYDIALMSRELITKYPQIHNYSTIWMENITHTTRRGSEEFGLTNTNKLIRQYPYATGLKTGSTSLAKYCVSATAEKDGIELIAVVMAAPDPAGRFADATALLNYGYAKCSLYQDLEEQPVVEIPVRLGVAEEVRGEYDGTFSYLSTTGEDLSSIEKKWLCVKELKAPVAKGQEIGKLTYVLGGKEIGSVPILAAEAVEKAGYSHYLGKAFGSLLL